MALFIIIFNICSNYKYEAVYKKIDNNIVKNLKKTTPNQLDIKLDGNITYYNKVENIFYYYINEKYNNEYLDLDLQIFSNKKYNYVIDNEKYNKKQKFYINYSEPVKIILYDNNEYFEIKLQFTSVPILSINADEIMYSDNKSTMSFYGMIDDKLSYLESDLLIKIRGASSLIYPKKQYRLSLSKGKSKNEVAFLGMESDEDWILDSMYSDYSKIRSKLAFELWNEINSYTNNEIDNDIQLEYVDVYLNDEYIGLYLLKEVIDKKLLKLNDTTNSNSGILIKGTSLEEINLSEYEINKQSNIVIPFEMKYPSNIQNYSVYWDSIISKIYNYYFDKSKVNDQYIVDTFYINNFVDYKIFSNLIAAIDNLKHKNIFLSTNDMDSKSKVLITPWDLDMTFGYYWDENPITLLGCNYENYLWPYDLLKNSDYINTLIIDRYFELRESKLSVEHVYSLIDSYYNQIKYSVIRDSEIWLDTDLEKEISDIKSWYKKRVKFLDEYLGEYDV